VSFGGLSAEAARAVSDEINALCRIVHKDVHTYVDAFDYPKVSQQ